MLYSSRSNKLIIVMCIFLVAKRVAKYQLSISLVPRLGRH